MSADKNDPDIAWIPDNEGRIVIGIRKTVRNGETALELVDTVGSLVGTVTQENAARLIDMLEAGIEFSDIVGGTRFRIDLSEI